jgi:nucleotide-binding universal stress UspA family protein
MFTTIVLALDGSELSEAAVDATGEFAALTSASVVAVHVKTHALETERERLIDAQITRLRAAGVPVEVELASTVVGDEANVIARAAKRHAADLIVAVGRGRSPAVGSLIGSVTQRLLHVADCPVLVIPAVVGDAESELVVHAAEARR